MSFLKSFFYARMYRRKKAVTSQEFIDAMERDFNRTLDTNSTFFFRHHPVTVNLLHRLLTGQITIDETEGTPLIMTALMFDMTESLVELTESEFAKINDSKGNLEKFSATLEAFSRTYPDAGNIVGQGVIFLFRKGN